MKAQSYLDRKSIGECDEGWRKIIDPLLIELAKRDGSVYQIKEKFGGLRFYYGETDQDEAFAQMVMKAERDSFTICEKCGEPGEARYNRWVKTLCEKHHQERLTYQKAMGL